MTDLITRERVEARPPEVRRRPTRTIYLSAIGLAVVVGIAVGFTSFDLFGGLGVQEIQDVRAAQLVEQYEERYAARLRIEQIQELRAQQTVDDWTARWNTPNLTVAEIQQVRAAQMVDHFADRYAAQQERIQEIQRLRAEQMVEFYEQNWAPAEP